MTSPRNDDSADWRAHLLESNDQIRELLSRTRRIAVLGIKTEAQSFQPAYYVPEYVQSEGYEIVPVPVYYPEVTAILGQPVFRRVADIPGDIDLVNVFRRPQDVPPHVDDILAKRPMAVWMQSGIRHDEVAARRGRAGIGVVQDRGGFVVLR
jgi:predicted CoA-binding protein